MQIGSKSKYLLKKTRSKAKMHEYGVPAELHIAVENNANELLLIAISAIGNITAGVLNENNPYRIIPAEKKAELEFASRYFDAFLHSNLEPSYPQYYLLLGAIAYYLCDYTGSAKVMAKKLVIDELDLDCNGIEIALALLLQDKMDRERFTRCVGEDSYRHFLYQVIAVYDAWFRQHQPPELNFINEFRSFIYSHGSSRELLLADALLAILLIKMERSALKLLPVYSGLESDDWEGLLRNKRNIHELWPTQIRLGEAGIFAGKSAIIQTPTSSGKTTSMSIAIRSAFLAKRTTLAIVVAPFRALCREISNDIANDFLDDPNVHVNELSDVLEIGDLTELLAFLRGESKNIMVLTPEKLIYLLRQDIELIKGAGLIIFDEAHMFDDATRGAHYELLISTIMMYLNKDAQKLLLSAVIPNAAQINEWFTGGEGAVIADNSIRSTEKSIAITDWQDRFGYLYFLDPENHNDLEFYVPRVIGVRSLNKLRKNEKQRFFPEVDFKAAKVMHNDIAINLALKLNHNGGVAIFCGRKDTVDGVLRRIIELETRGIDISSFLDGVVNSEHEKIAQLIKENYGQDNTYYKAAMKGIFAHHRGISNGVKIATEHAMKEGLIRCIVCTSTLAQGVNLPIRYLIISSLYQAQDRIKVRDFHNLIGRAGRAGLYTEGTILLSESFVYSRRGTPKEGWRWRGYLEMLDSGNSESCLSQFLLLVHPKVFEVSYETTVTYDFYLMILARYNSVENYEERAAALIDKFVEKYPKQEYTFKSTIAQINRCIDAIESYLLSFLTNNNDQDIDILVSSTFGYFLASEEEKERMKTIFSTIKEYLLNTIESADKRSVFSRTLLGAKQLLELEGWVGENAEKLINCETTSEALQLVIAKLVKYSEDRCLKAIITEDAAANMASMWIGGASYKQIFDYATENDVRIIRRKKEANVLLEEIIDICENGFGYASTLIINAISELLHLLHEGSDSACELLGELSKQMRYGLPSKKSIIIYESGFGDRVISLRLAAILKGTPFKNKRQLRKVATENKSELMEALAGFPRVFTQSMVEITL
jgi:replicative superfamily II helicase